MRNFSSLVEVEGLKRTVGVSARGCIGAGLPRTKGCPGISFNGLRRRDEQGRCGCADGQSAGAVPTFKGL